MLGAEEGVTGGSTSPAPGAPSTAAPALVPLHGSTGPASPPPPRDRRRIRRRPARAAAMSRRTPRAMYHIVGEPPPEVVGQGEYWQFDWAATTPVLGRSAAATTIRTIATESATGMAGWRLGVENMRCRCPEAHKRGHGPVCKGSAMGPVGTSPQDGPPDRQYPLIPGAPVA